MKYWIQDEDKTPQRFPLKSLFLAITQLLSSEDFQLKILRSHGYGAKVCEWDNLLDEQDSILVDRELLENLLEGIDQWFYNLDVEILAEGFPIVRFGLHDSTAMYIDAPEEVADSIVKTYKKVHQAKG